MGIRIHKSIGYAVSNFQKPEGWEEERMERAHKTYLLGDDGFLVWCSEHQTKILEHYKGPEWKVRTGLNAMFFPQEGWTASLGSFIVESSEMGIPGVLQLIPPGYPEFRRYDNIIDWVEETASGSAEPKLKYLDTGLYPFEPCIVPVPVIGLALWLEIPQVIPHLKESIYTFWG